MLRKYIRRVVEDYIHSTDAWSITQQDALELSRGFEMGAAGQPRPKARFASQPTARRSQHFRSMGWDMARAAHTGAVTYEPKAPEPKAPVVEQLVVTVDGKTCYEVRVDGKLVLRAQADILSDKHMFQGAVKALEAYLGVAKAV